MSAYDDYLAALRELDVVRGAQADAAQARKDRQSQLGAAVDGLWERLNAQRAKLSRLAGECGLPAPPTRPAPSPPPADPAAEVTAAAADVDAADAGYADSRYLAHRSKLLPRWRADERNGLVYGAWALLSLLMQAAVLFVASGEAGLGDVVGHIAIVALLPVLAFAAGWLTIGVVTRPTLGEGGNGPDGKLVRNPRLGIVICLSTWLVSCWLGNVYLN